METQNKLEIHHVAKRLPYGLKVQFRNDKGDNITEVIEGLVHERNETWVATEKNGMYLQECKPILFPSDSINQKILIKGQEFCPLDLIYKDFESVQEWNKKQIKYHFCKIPLEIIDKFLEWHIDTDNLIEKGLAISVLELTENPYA